jgi:hypothetical protein
MVVGVEAVAFTAEAVEAVGFTEEAVGSVGCTAEAEGLLGFMVGAVAGMAAGFIGLLPTVVLVTP